MTKASGERTALTRLSWPEQSLYGSMPCFLQPLLLLFAALLLAAPPLHAHAKPRPLAIVPPFELGYDLAATRAPRSTCSHDRRFMCTTPYAVTADHLFSGRSATVPTAANDSMQYGPSLAPQFTGKERDAETGLDYFGARYMSAAQGRFTSPDPKLFPDATFDPQSWNKYAYVRNNPLRLVDPNGEDWKDVASGFMNAFNTNQVLGIGRTEGGNSDFRNGQAFGDAASTLQGVAEILIGGGGEVGGVALDATGVGAVAGVPLNIASAAVITHGVAVGGTGLKNLTGALFRNGTDVPNPDGSKGKPDHQAKVEELTGKAKGEAKTG